MIATLFFLLVIYQIKHLLADYFWQNGYQLGKFKPGWDFVGPLAVHCAIHATCTFAIAIFFKAWWVALLLAAFDFVVHFIMDRIKAGPKYLGRFKPVSGQEYITFTSELKEAPSGDCFQREARKYAAERLRGNIWFWRSLGIDQTVHHLTHYAIIAYLVLS